MAVAELDRAARRRVAIIVVSFLLGALLVGAAAAIRDARSEDRFDLVRWERNTLLGKLVHAVGAPLRDDLDADEAIVEYFALEDRTGEGDALENAVEAAIEGRIDAVLQDLGLNARLPLFGPLSIFPPVDVELVAPPQVLVVSPRDRIERRSADLLRPDLTLEDIEAIEARVEVDDRQVSALVVRSGGVATYPAIVTDTRSYRGTVETAAHEWVHHYLTFYPLGIRYFTSNDAESINETVADIVGDEVAALVLERYGDPTTPAPPGEQPAVDRNEVLRNLRLEVDDLLAAGRVDEAEGRMNEVRDELCAAGICIRKINQAFFAWFGTYAARPDSVDPLGPQLRELRDLSSDIGDFLSRVRGAGGRDDIERLLSNARVQAESDAESRAGG
jgi:hypothetical protein